MPRSTIRAKLYLAFGVLIGITLAVTALSVWSSSQARFLLERSRLAHRVLEQHLELHVDTLNLFKQFVDALIVNQHTAMDDEDAYRALHERLSDVRNAILAELTLVAATAEKESEKEEFRAVDAIEEEIRQITTGFDEVRRLVQSGATDRAWPLLGRILEEQIDGRLAMLLEAAIAEEMREVAEADRIALTMHRRADIVAKIAALAAVLVGLTVVLVLQHQVRRPFKRLLAGTQALAQGDLGHRVATGNGDEFGQLAASFNAMAERVERGRQELLAARDALEATVNARTEELRRANLALTRADQVRRRFFADISHELRTPLTVIRGESEITLRGPDKSTADYKTSLERVREQSAHLAQLVDDLLFVARAEAGMVRLQRQTVNLASLLRDVCRDGTVLGRERGVQVDLRESVSDGSVVGDPGKLRQLLLIVVDNAIRYSRPGGTVAVDLNRAPGGLAIRVSDEGVGIPPEEIETIFEPFYRGANAPPHHDEGSGLGLPVAKAIVEAHGGEIRVESELDHGTVVTVILPASGKLKAIA